MLRYVIALFVVTLFSIQDMSACPIRGRIQTRTKIVERVRVQERTTVVPIAQPTFNIVPVQQTLPLSTPTYPTTKVEVRVKVEGK